MFGTSSDELGDFLRQEISLEVITPEQKLAVEKFSIFKIFPYAHNYLFNPDASSFAKKVVELLNLPGLEDSMCADPPVLAIGYENDHMKYSVRVPPPQLEVVYDITSAVPQLTITPGIRSLDFQRIETDRDGIVGFSASGTGVNISYSDERLNVSIGYSKGIVPGMPDVSEGVDLLSCDALVSIPGQHPSFKQTTLSKMDGELLDTLNMNKVLDNLVYIPDEGSRPALRFVYDDRKDAIIYPYFRILPMGGRLEVRNAAEIGRIDSCDSYSIDIIGHSATDSIDDTTYFMIYFKNHDAWLKDYHGRQIILK